METLSFWIWFIAVGLTASIGLGSMIVAYQGKGSVAVVFAEPVALAEPSSPTGSPVASTLLQQGCESYRQGNYRQAVQCFNQAIEQDDQLAEAYHNRGRATANLRRVTEAISDLVKASDRYLQRGNTAGAERIKQDLLLLKQTASPTVNPTSKMA